MWWLRELLSCWKFLWVTGNEPWYHSKRIYELIVPGVLSVALYGFYLLWPQIFIANFLSEFSGKVFQFMVFVVPFHLAALAALATYPAEILDETLRGSNAQLRVWSNTDNEYYYVDLTLRQYVSLLFGYLCGIGILYILIYIIATTLDFSYILRDGYRYVYSIFVFLVLFFVFQYVILTIYAITFLFDKANKIHCG